MSDYGCIIPAAGTGSRISELSKYIPKFMLPLSPSFSVLDNILSPFHSRFIPRYLGIRDEYRWMRFGEGRVSNRIVAQEEDDGLIHNGFADMIRLLQIVHENSPVNHGYYIISADAVVHRNDVLDFIDQTQKEENRDHPCIAIWRTDDEELLRRAGNAYCSEDGNLELFKEKPVDNFAKHIACSLYYVPVQVAKQILKCVRHPIDRTTDSLYDNMGHIIFWFTEDYYSGGIQTYNIQNYWTDISDLNSYIEAVRIYNEGA